MDVRVRRGRRGVAVLLLAALLASSPLTPGLGVRSAAAAEAQADRIRQQIRQIEEQIRRLERDRRAAQGQLAQLRRQRQQLAYELQVLDEQIERKAAQLERKQAELRVAEEALERTRRELGELEAELRYRERLRGVRVRALYERGTVAILDVLLQANSFADFLRRFLALREILAHDVLLLQRTQELRDQVDARRRELEARRRQIATLVASIAEDRRELEAVAEQKEAKLGQVQRQAAEVERLLDEMDQQLNDASRRLHQLYRELARLGPAPGKFLFPVDTSGYWRISSEFGMRYHPILRRPRMHTGLDVAARTGTPVYAAADGEVGYAGWLGGYGKTIILVHGGGLQTVYAHLSAIEVAVGQRVEAGERIGRVGSTGFSTGPHLHFEVRKNGEPVNPRPYLTIPR